MILLDTHVALWLLSEPAKLSDKATAAIQEARRSGEPLAICDVTLLELATIANKGRIVLSMALESFLHTLEERFAVLPITARACAKITELPSGYPKDPADRIIGAIAIVEGLVLITADREIRQSKAVQTIW